MASASPELCPRRPRQPSVPRRRSVRPSVQLPAPLGAGATRQDSRARPHAGAALPPAQPGCESPAAEVPSGARARIRGSRRGSWAMPFLSRPSHIPPEERGLPAAFASLPNPGTAAGCAAPPLPRLSPSQLSRRAPASPQTGGRSSKRGGRRSPGGTWDSSQAARGSGDEARQPWEAPLPLPPTPPKAPPPQSEAAAPQHGQPERRSET